MRNLFLLALIFLLFQQLSAQTYDEAINLFKENKHKEATAVLKVLQQQDKEKARASLALSVIEADEQRYLSAFKDFKVFFMNHPNPYPFVYAMNNSGIFSRGASADNEEVSQFLNDLLTDPKANATIKSGAIDILGAGLERQGDFEAARKMFENLHDVKNWSTVGVFENVSASGFNKDFGPLAHFETSSQFTNKSGASVQWFEIPEVRTDRWWDMTYYHNINDAVIYCQTFIGSEADKDVLLMAGVSGSLKIWLNNILVASEPEERNTDEDVYTYKVKLQKGINRLLVQTGSSEIDRNNFMIRFADESGNLLTDITSSPIADSFIIAKPYDVKQAPFFAEQYFQREVARDPQNFISQLLLLDVYNHNEKKYEAHKTVALLKKMAPGCTLVSEKIIATADIDDNVIDAAREKEHIKSNDPESLTGLILRYEEAYSKENWDEAISLLKLRDELYGENASTKLELISIYNKRKEIEKLVKEEDAAFEKYPGNEKIVELQYALTLQQSKDAKKAKSILKNYLKDHYDENIMEIIIENDLKNGDKKEAIDYYKTEIENSPFSAGKCSKLAMVYYEMHEYDEAMEWIQKSLKLCPYTGRYFYSAGLIYNGKGDKEKAIEMMRKCVYYSPANYEAREKLRMLENKKKLFEYFKQNDVVKIYKEAQGNPAYAKEEAVILINDKREIVYPEHGAGEEQEEMLVYINSQTAIHRYKEYAIPHNGYNQKLIVEKAELLKKDGSKVPAERQKGYVVFSSMAVGDAMHLYYKLENSYEGKLAEHFWNGMYFNNVYPVQSSSFSLLIPANMHFEYKITNKDVKPEVSNIEDYQLLRWEEKDLPKIVAEPLMNYEAFDKLSVTSIPDWSYVANWYSDVSNVKTKADFEVKEKVKELMAGNETKTGEEKARIIYDYIEDNYNYSAVPFLHSAFTPQRASRTLSTKLGDCKDLSTLFVSMAREAGLDASLVLVRTNGSGDDDLDLPAISFNHCIARLKADDKTYLVELTNNHLPFAAMGSSLLNAHGLYIPKDGASINNIDLKKLNSDARPVNANVRHSDLWLDNDNAIIHRTVYKIGSESAAFRYFLKDLDDDARIKKLTETVSGEFNKNIKIENLKVDNLKTLSDTLILNYDIKVSNFSSDIVGMKVFRLPWTDSHLSEQIFSLEKRKYPLNFGVYSSTPSLTETITFSVPKGKKLAELPKDVTISCPAMNYNLKYERAGDKITVHREIRYLKDIIMPGEYQEVKDAVSKINQADGKEIAMK